MGYWLRKSSPLALLLSPTVLFLNIRRLYRVPGAASYIGPNLLPSRDIHNYLSIPSASWRSLILTTSRRPVVFSLSEYSPHLISSTLFENNLLSSYINSDSHQMLTFDLFIMMRPIYLMVSIFDLFTLMSITLEQ